MPERRAGALSRRDFVAQAGSAALAAAGAGTLLAACGAPRPRAPGLEAELHIYNWSDYIGPDTIGQFEEETGVTVTYDTYESNEELVGKLLAGGAAYDLCVPTSYVLPLLAAKGVLAPLDRARLPNFRNVAPLFLDPAVDPGNRFGVPYQWGVTGIAYLRSQVTEPASWGVFLDGTVSGRKTMMDDGREVLGAMLRHRGHSLNSTDAAELAQARADAVTAKGQLAAFVSAPVKGQLVAGDVCLAQLWNGDTRQAQAENPDIGFVVPREGSLIWADYVVMLAGCRHPHAAHAFLDFILRPDVGAGISDATGYGTANAAAAERLRNPVPYPTAEELARLEYQVDLGPATALWDRLWTEVKAA